MNKLNYVVNKINCIKDNVSQQVRDTKSNPFEVTVTGIYVKPVVTSKKRYANPESFLRKEYRREALASTKVYC
jgi:hypothetical protein